MKTVNPIEIFGDSLCSVQNPSVYIGGEFGSVVKRHGEGDGLLNFGIAFPDLYEIGMSNQAVKIIYNALNSLETVRCERVFAVEGDFEELLKERGIPLYTLETGIALCDLDILGFSIGYELGITGVLSMLELGKIPILKGERGEDSPIVIAGGCGATNPAPFSDFFDAIFIGEAEGGMFELVERLSLMKKGGASRKEMVLELERYPNVWSDGMSKEKCGHDRAFRAVWSDFGQVPSVESFLPLPNVKPVQDHGVVEIMRGCPNGCRFCHAGIYYRPQRAKSRRIIIEEIEKIVGEAGSREISLTSLSSADYPKIGGLLDELNLRFKERNVSFQLPSLKVNSFSLPLLEKISAVRKSGLTFAVETPDEAWQMMLNKEVYAQHLVQIILDAKRRGWNKAKFYFMVGLPFPETCGKSEEKAIVDFMLELQERTRIQCNVNVGVFIPKPHTPYQWARQLSPEEAEKKLFYIRENLPRGRFHVGAHTTETGYIEGLISRGDRRAGGVILSAYRNGARLDAWENRLRENIGAWEKAFDGAGYDVRSEILRERSLDECLPWDSVSLGPSKSFYKSEWKRHLDAILTKRCSESCDHRCGVCDQNTKVLTETESGGKAEIPVPEKIERAKDNIPVMYRAVFEFSKKDGGQFFSHISQVETFNRAILKSALPIIYTTGFNPIPRLEFATTLSLGIESESEIASTVLFDPIPEKEFAEKLNENLPKFFGIKKCLIFPVTNKRRRESLSSGLWGSVYEYSFKKGEGEISAFHNSEAAKKFTSPESRLIFDLAESKIGGKSPLTIPFALDRPFRNALEEFFGGKIWEIASIKKVRTLAKCEIANLKGPPEFLELFRASGNAEFTDYFELYARIAELNRILIENKSH